MPSSSFVNVVLAVIVDRAVQPPRVLVTRRPEAAVMGGWWELPGGKLDAGEAPADGLVRECREELGIDVEAGRKLAVIEHAYAHAHVRLHAYWARHMSGEIMHLAVADHRWVTASELETYRMLPANGPLVRRIRETLERGGGEVG